MSGWVPPPPARASKPVYGDRTCDNCASTVGAPLTACGECGAALPYVALLPPPPPPPPHHDAHKGALPPVPYRPGSSGWHTDEIAVPYAAPTYALPPVPMRQAEQQSVPAYALPPVPSRLSEAGWSTSQLEEAPPPPPPPRRAGEPVSPPPQRDPAANAQWALPPMPARNRAPTVDASAVPPPPPRNRQPTYEAGALPPPPPRRLALQPQPEYDAPAAEFDGGTVEVADLSPPAARQPRAGPLPATGWNRTVPSPRGAASTTPASPRDKPDEPSQPQPPPARPAPVAAAPVAVTPAPAPAAADEKPGLFRSLSGRLVNALPKKVDDAPNGPPPDDCTSALRDPYWRTQLQAHATEQGCGATVTLWTLMDEFKNCASSSSSGAVKGALAKRIYAEFIADTAPQRAAYPGTDANRRVLAADYLAVGPERLPATFFDSPQGLLLVDLEARQFPAWRATLGARKSPKAPRTRQAASKSVSDMSGSSGTLSPRLSPRLGAKTAANDTAPPKIVVSGSQSARTSSHVVGSPTLVTPPKTKYTLVPIKDAQEAAGVQSEADSSAASAPPIAGSPSRPPAPPPPSLLAVMSVLKDPTCAQCLAPVIAGKKFCPDCGAPCADVSPVVSPQLSPRSGVRRSPYAMGQPAGATTSSGLLERKSDRGPAPQLERKSDRGPAPPAPAAEHKSERKPAPPPPAARSPSPATVHKVPPPQQSSPPAGQRKPAPPPPTAEAAHRRPENFVGDDKWDVESILSDDCKFEWSALNSGNTVHKLDTIKCLVVGDLGTGKTQLCKTMLGDEFDRGYQPTVFETYKIRVPMPFKDMPVEMWDMSGSQKYDKKRPVVYPNVNAIIVCFDLTSHDSWESVKRKWVPEALSFPECPLFVVGCKLDTISASNAANAVSASEVRKFMDHHCITFKCSRFFSTSAQTGAGLEEVFQALVYATLYAPKTADGVNVGLSSAIKAVIK